MINLYGYSVGNKVVVLGSGDVGMIVSHHLKESGAHVEGVFEIENRLGGLRRNKSRYLDIHGIPLITGSTVTKLHGQQRLEAVSVCLVDESSAPIPGTEKIIPCDTLVTSVGLIPETELLRGLDIEFGSEKIPSSADTSTSLPWLFICGNARIVHSLVDSVVSEGAQAGIAAAEYASQEYL